jgi:hypothetical protein
MIHNLSKGTHVAFCTCQPNNTIIAWHIEHLTDDREFVEKCTPAVAIYIVQSDLEFTSFSMAETSAVETF